MSNIRYTEEQKQFIIKYSGHLKSKEVAKLFNEKFNDNITWKQINAFRKRYNICPRHKYQYKIGDERTRTTGVWIKIGEPDIWIFKQKYLYEKYKGKVPRNSSVIFADGDKTNFDLDNLILSNDPIIKVMHNNALPRGQKDLCKTGLLIAKLKIKLKKYKEELVNE